MIKSNFMNLLRIAFFTTFSILVFQKGFGQASSHTISISNIKAKRGNLMIGWYNSEASYNERNNPIFKKLVTVNQQKEVTVVFEKIPAGKYAISMFLDENGNKEMDTNFLGIPKEQYGFSNNVLPATRAANFDEASFDVKDNPSTISIRLK